MATREAGSFFRSTSARWAGTSETTADSHRSDAIFERPVLALGRHHGLLRARHRGEHGQGQQRIEHPGQELFVAHEFLPLGRSALAARHFARIFSISVQAMWRDFSFLPYSVSPIFPGVI